jgi:RimJ/RimL family protein N-acetyltransferase
MTPTAVPAEIRALTAADAEAFSRLRRAVTAVDPVGMGLSMDEELSRSIEGFRSQLGAAAPSAVFGAFVGGELVATAAVSPTVNFASAAHKRVMWGVFTHPTMRRRGLSRAVVRRAIAHAFETGARRINLLVYVPNEPAVALYRSLGFVACGSEPEAVHLDGRFFDGVHMTLTRAAADQQEQAVVSPEGIVQRQLQAYNDHDLEAFLATYTQDATIFRMPASSPTMSGHAAIAQVYAKVFALPGRHAQILSRTVLGNKVVDHERVTADGAPPLEALAVYEVRDERIASVWLFAA